MSSAPGDTTPLQPGQFRLISPEPRSWPFGDGNEIRQSSTAGELEISVLDSSFNPPTLAHLALASAPTYPTNAAKGGISDTEAVQIPRLLLFSPSNADKKLSPGDPNLEQRLILISLLAKHLSTVSDPDVAVGVINEATFVGKSRILHSHFTSQLGWDEKPRLVFAVGTDTLVRFFDPRYYGAEPQGITGALSSFFDEEQSTLLCVRRAGEQEIENALKAREEVKRYLEKKQVSFWGSGTEDWAGISSTQVRRAVKGGDWDVVRRMVIPSIADFIQHEELYLY